MRKIILAGLSAFAAAPSCKTLPNQSPSQPRAILSKGYPDIKLSRKKSVFRPTDSPYSFPMDGWANDAYLKKNLPTEAKKRLETNGFVLMPTDFKDIYALYEDITTTDPDHTSELGGPPGERGPVFITTDLTLHTLHLLMDYSLRAIELMELLPRAESLTALMLKNSIHLYENSTNKAKKAAALNMGYFCVAARLLEISPDVELPPGVTERVEMEIGLINASSGFSESPLLGINEDYSQYKPRGHYTRNEDFKRYFKAMMWFGRMGFPPEKNPVSPGADPELLTISAILQSIALCEDTTALRLWNEIYETTAFFVGESDDLTPLEYYELAKEVWGHAAKPNELNDAKKLSEFRAKASALRKPRVLSGLSASFSADTVKIPVSYRFMGQRFIPDAYMMQELIAGRIGIYAGRGNPFTLTQTELGPARGFALGLDVMSVLGSGLAEDIIKTQGDNEYAGYAEKVEYLRKWWWSIPDGELASTLYGMWFYTLEILLTDSSAPAGVRKIAWYRKNLLSSLGSWAELRHDVILYAKQPYGVKLADGGAGPPPLAKKELGACEPYPEAFRAQARIAITLSEFLEAKGWAPEVREKLDSYAMICNELAEIAENGGVPLDNEGHHSLWRMPERLKATTDLGWELMERITNPYQDSRMAIVADVMTDPNSGQCLEEAVGNPAVLLVLVVIHGKPYIAEGACFTYYEFKQPLNDRLSDPEWHEILDGGKPQMPSWADEIMGRASGPRPGY
ncbi:MAG: DUF3160 domain-containing protein [candidate division WOR-3 bacterium]